MAMRTLLKQPEKNAQRDSGEKGWACYYCVKEGKLKQDCPQASKPCPRLHVRPAKDHTGGETAPRGVGFRGQTLKTTSTEVPVLITSGESRVLITVGSQSIDFLLDTGAEEGIHRAWTLSEACPC